MPSQRKENRSYDIYAVESSLALLRWAKLYGTRIYCRWLAYLHLTPRHSFHWIRHVPPYHWWGCRSPSSQCHFRSSASTVRYTSFNVQRTTILCCLLNLLQMLRQRFWAEWKWMIINTNVYFTLKINTSVWIKKIYTIIEATCKLEIDL